MSVMPGARVAFTANVYCPGTTPGCTDMPVQALAEPSCAPPEDAVGVGAGVLPGPVGTATGLVGVPAGAVGVLPGVVGTLPGVVAVVPGAVGAGVGGPPALTPPFSTNVVTEYGGSV